MQLITTLFCLHFSIIPRKRSLEFESPSISDISGSKRIYLNHDGGKIIALSQIANKLLTENYRPGKLF